LRTSGNTESKSSARYSWDGKGAVGVMNA
jgi:hypothetical protein